MVLSERIFDVWECRGFQRYFISTEFFVLIRSPNTIVVKTTKQKYLGF